MVDFLIVHASFGQGHKKAACALGEYFHKDCYDLLDFTHPLIRKIYSSNYVTITQRIPFLWRSFTFLFRNKYLRALLNNIHKSIFSSFVKLIEKKKPQTVIITHFFPAGLLKSLKNKFEMKIITVITDLRVHPVWANEVSDYYIVALDQTRDDLIKLGVNKQKIFTGFASLRTGFLTDTSLDSECLSEKFMLPSRPAVLFMSSSRGNFPLLVDSIKELTKKYNLFIIYGNNLELKSYLEKLDSPHIQFFSYYKNIWELMSQSLVVVGKPGGLTVFEGIYQKTFFIFTHFIPGQEEGNMDVLIRAGVAKFATTKAELINGIEHFEKNQKNITDKYPLILNSAHIPINELIEKKDD